MGRGPGQTKTLIMGNEKKLGFFENFMLAGVAAGVSKTVAAPIERVKLLVQNQDEMIKQGRLDRPYNGVMDCCSRVLKTEGVYPFWRGNLANVLRYFPTQALNFAFKDAIKVAFATPKDASNAKKFTMNILSGGMAGTWALLFVYSLDFARTRLANDAKGKGGERQFNGLIDVYTKTLKSDGIQGLYRGFAISAVGIFIYRGMYFGMFDTLKPLLLGDNANVGLSFLLGWAVTITAGLMSYPIDTIRRRMMMTSGGSGVKNEGFMSMMKGAGANILRGVAGAGVLAGFDKFQAMYIAWRTSHEGTRRRCLWRPPLRSPHAETL